MGIIDKQSWIRKPGCDRIRHASPVAAEEGPGAPPGERGNILSQHTRPGPRHGNKLLRRIQSSQRKYTRAAPPVCIVYLRILVYTVLDFSLLHLSAS